MEALQLLALARKLANLYAGLSAPLCKRYGLNQTSFDVLMFCANNPGHNTARDVCTLRGIKSGMASVATEALIRGGLMLRQGDPDDRRIRRLVPTEKAEPIIRDGRAMQKRFAQALRRGMTQEEIGTFMRVAGKLMDNAALIDEEE